MPKSTLTIGIAWNGIGDLNYFLENSCSFDFVNEVLLAPAHHSAHELAKHELRSFTKLKILDPGDTGIYSAYNKLIKNCSTSHICFHGVDDFVLHNNEFNQTLQQLDSKCMYVLTAQLCSEDGQPLALYHHHESYPEAVRLGRFISPATPEVIYPATVLRQIGGADESFRIAGDADLYFRARAACNRIDIEKIFVNMRDGGASTTAKNSRIVFVENSRIAKNQNQSITHGEQFIASLLLNGRYLLYRLAGERFSNRITDLLRLLVGRSPRFSRR